MARKNCERACITHLKSVAHHLQTLRIIPLCVAYISRTHARQPTSTAGGTAERLKTKETLKQYLCKVHASLITKHDDVSVMCVRAWDTVVDK